MTDPLEVHREAVRAAWRAVQRSPHYAWCRGAPATEVRKAFLPPREQALLQMATPCRPEDVAWLEGYEEMARGV